MFLLPGDRPRCVVVVFPQAHDESALFLDEIGIRAVVRPHARDDLARHAQTGRLDVAAVAQYLLTSGGALRA